MEVSSNQYRLSLYYRELIYLEVYYTCAIRLNRNLKIHIKYAPLKNQYEKVRAFGNHHLGGLISRIARETAKVKIKKRNQRILKRESKRCEKK